MNRAGKLLRSLKLPADCLDREQLVRATWPAAVGRRIASHTRPVGMEGARLIVEVEDSEWQRQLRTLHAQILAKLAAIAGPENVSAIDFRPGVPRRLPQRAAQLRSGTDEADGIREPILRHVYREARKRSGT